MAKYTYKFKNGRKREFTISGNPFKLVLSCIKCGKEEVSRNLEIPENLQLMMLAEKHKCSKK